MARLLPTCMPVPAAAAFRAAAAWLPRLLLCGALAACAQKPAPGGDAMAAYPPTEPGAPVPASAQTREAFAALGPGINFGNMLDAPREGDWGSRVDERYAALAWEAGFRHVRLPVRWSNHASLDAQARIDPAFMARVEQVVDQLLAQGFTVVLNMHHYRELDGDKRDHHEAGVDRADLKPRFLSMWQQIAERFASRSPRLWFELYNEPHGSQTAAEWNDLAARALRVVRQRNPERVVVIGPVQWNSARALSQLSLPPDARLVATVHHYEPFRFTHQQAEWSREMSGVSGVRCCDGGQRRQIDDPLDLAQAWAQRHGVPVWLGEFGAYGGPPGKPNDMASRVAYTRAVREAAEHRGMAWAYWELDSGFGVYDKAAHQWREPLLEALLGR